MKYFIFIRLRSIFLITLANDTCSFKFVALRARNCEANNAGYRFLREPTRGRKFRRKDAVGDEKPTGRRNLAQRQPPRRAPRRLLQTVLKFPRPRPTTLLPTPSDHLACSRGIQSLPLFFFVSFGPKRRRRRPVTA